MFVQELDVMPSEAAARLLTSCCGARAWVSGVLDRRPFGTLETLLAAADHVWASLTPADWREAFDHHPRIGARSSAVPQDTRAQSWSSHEQAGVDQAGAVLRDALRQANEEYESRFGFICIICASGRSADEMLAITRGRLSNHPAAEICVAAEEQRQITRLRLARLFHDPAGALR